MTLDINYLFMYTSFYISDEKDDTQAGKVNIIGKRIILYSTWPLKNVQTKQLALKIKRLGHYFKTVLIRYM